MQIITAVIGVFLFALGFFLIARATRVPIADRQRFLRAGVGAMAAGAGNALLYKNQSAALLLLLVGVMLIFTSGNRPDRRGP